MKSGSPAGIKSEKESESKNSTASKPIKVGKLSEASPISVVNFLILALTLIVSWQIDSGFKLQSRISDLEQLLLSATEHLEKDVHAPHSHYNVAMNEDGVPLDADREYYIEDFQEVFHVRPLIDVEWTAEAVELLKDVDVTKDAYYGEMLDEIEAVKDRCQQYLDHVVMSNIDDKFIAVKWESKSTGFSTIVKRDYQEGEVVGLYTGIVYPSYPSEYPDTDYTWDYPSIVNSTKGEVTFGVDARVAGNVLRFVNHAGDSSNTKSFTVPLNGRWYVFYIAVKAIPAGAWLTSDYGEGF